MPDGGAAQLFGRQAASPTSWQAALHFSRSGLTIRQAGSTKRKQAEQERIQAGLRLIEVRERFVKECGQDRCPHEFAQWYRDSGFEQYQVSRLMKLAGSDEEQRDEQRKKERDRKRQAGSRRSAPGRPHHRG